MQQFQTPNFDMSPERVIREIKIHPLEVAIVSDVENVPDLAMLLAEFATE